MLDIDHFKAFNDTYGHQAGDMVIKEVADILKEDTPDKDCAGRYGGEEFSIILPCMQEDAARSLAEKIAVGWKAGPSVIMDMNSM